MKNSKIQWVLVAIFVVSFSALRAQTQVPQMRSQAVDVEVSQEELKTFSGVAKEVQKIQRASQANMREVISNQGLDIQTYSKIARAQRMPDSSNNFTADQITKFQKAQTKLRKKQEKVRQKIFKKIEEEGMSLQKYKQIAKGIQQDPELRSRFQEIQANTKE